MKSYGEFPEKVDIALLRLKDDYLGKLRTNLTQIAAKETGVRSSPVSKSQEIPQ